MKTNETIDQQLDLLFDQMTLIENRQNLVEEIEIIKHRIRLLDIEFQKINEKLAGTTYDNE